MRIQNKLFLVSIFGSGLLVASMFILMQWGVDRGLLAYINIREAEQWQPVTESLATYYRESGNWQALEDNPQEFHSLVRSVGPERKRRGAPLHSPKNRDYGPPKRDRAEIPPRGRQRSGVLLANADGTVIVGPNRSPDNYQPLPILLDDKPVGYLMLRKRDQVTEDFELNFLSQQRESFVVISLIVLLFSAISSLPLARQIVAPIRRLAAAMHQLTQGDYQQMEERKRKDELGDLTRNFNLLSQTLKNNDSARKRWLADTSHELRTPIAIVRGELEAMLDGVRPLDEASIHSALQEVLHLGRLIDDLHELSNSDIGAMRYRMQNLNFNELVEEVIQQHRALLDAQHLRLTFEVPKHSVEVNGDETRLNQLLSNLLSNSIKYTDANGEVKIQLEQKKGVVEFRIDDSSPGVGNDDIDKLFDYLYRVESSRNRKTGGSGLGLAICQRIAEAHKGSLSAKHSSLGGVAISFQLPAVGS